MSIGEEGYNSEATAGAQRIRVERVLQGWEGAIGDREEEGRGEKLRKMRKMEGRMVNGQEERVYIVVQAARRHHARSGAAKRRRERAVVAPVICFLSIRLSLKNSHVLALPTSFLSSSQSTTHLDPPNSKRRAKQQQWASAKSAPSKRWKQTCTSSPASPSYPIRPLIRTRPNLQHKIRRDPRSYEQDFLTQYHQYHSHLEIFLQAPSSAADVGVVSLRDLIDFISHVADCYPAITKGFAGELIDLLKAHHEVLESELREKIVGSLVLLRKKDVLGSSEYVYFRVWWQD
jgi:NUC130/3NT domain